MKLDWNMHEWCTLYFQMYFVPSDVLCTFTFESTNYIRRYIDTEESTCFFTGNRKRVQSTSESTFMYFRMYFVLSIVLCTFKCTLKSTRCTFDNVRKHNLTFSKNEKHLLCTCKFFVWVVVIVPEYMHSLKSVGPQSVVT